MRAAIIALTAATVAAALAPATAAAELPSPHPPGKGAAAVVKSWPVQGRQTKVVAPGTRITVRVASARRKVRLALIKVGNDGAPVRAIKRRTLRHGTARFTLAEAGATYQLRLQVGNRRYWSWLTVDACGLAEGDRADLRLDALTARPGGTLGYQIVNTSDAGCVTTGDGYFVERLLTDGTWVRAAGPSGMLLIGHVIAPGKALAKQAALPADLATGRYRIVDSVFGRRTPEGPTARLELRLSAEFDVAS